MTIQKRKKTRDIFVGAGIGYSVIPDMPIAGRPSYLGYPKNCKPILIGAGTGRKDCGCKSNPLLKEYLDTQTGGTSMMSPLSLISKISTYINPIKPVILINMIIILLSYYYKSRKQTKKTITSTKKVSKKSIKKTQRKYQKGGSLLLSLGTSNIIVLAAILLLHHFVTSKMSHKKYVTSKMSHKKQLHKGGSTFTIMNKLMSTLHKDKYRNISKLIIVKNLPYKRKYTSNKLIRTLHKSLMSSNPSVKKLSEQLSPISIVTFYKIKK